MFGLAQRSGESHGYLLFRVGNPKADRQLRVKSWARDAPQRFQLRNQKQKSAPGYWS
jgi:hypothetical protein